MWRALSEGNWKCEANPIRTTWEMGAWIDRTARCTVIAPAL